MSNITVSTHKKLFAKKTVASRVLRKNRGISGVDNQNFRKELSEEYGCEFMVDKIYYKGSQQNYKVYLKTGNDYFYYFAYQKGILSITSNNQKMEEEFNKMKPKEKIKKMDDGETFEMQWVELGAAEMFVRKVNAGQK